MQRKAILVMPALLILLASSPQTLAAGGPMRLVVRQPAKLPLAEEVFGISVEVANNPGLRAVQFSVEFDNDALECLDIEVGALPEGALSTANTDDSGAATVAIISLDAIQEDRVLATFWFRAKVDLESFDFRLSRITLCDGESNPIKCDIGETVSEGTLSGWPSGVPDDPIENKPTADPNESPDEHMEDGAELNTGNKLPISFSDISGHWGESYIIRSAERGLFQGYPDGSFRPDEKVSRAQFITVLWRAMGEPEPTKEAPLEDIDNQISEFRTAIEWAYESGNVYGTSATTFEPDKPLTRQEALTILHRCEGGEPGAELIFTEIYDDAFVDSGEIAQWAKTAMYWGVYHQIILGTEENVLSPEADTTRAQLAKIMLGYLDRFPKTQGHGGESG